MEQITNYRINLHKKKNTIYKYTSCAPREKNYPRIRPDWWTASRPLASSKHLCLPENQVLPFLNPCMNILKLLTRSMGNLLSSWQKRKYTWYSLSDNTIFRCSLMMLLRSQNQMTLQTPLYIFDVCHQDYLRHDESSSTFPSLQLYLHSDPWIHPQAQIPLSWTMVYARSRVIQSSPAIRTDVSVITISNYIYI